MDYQRIFNTLGEAGKKEFLERRRAPPPPPPGNVPYVNPQFADKEGFKTRDRLGMFRPGTKLYSSQRSELTEFQKSNLRANPKSPLTLMKPLRPNILDAAANERQKELADQRKRTGLKWVVVTQR